MFNLKQHGVAISFSLLFSICILNFFLFLGDVPIQDWDEARHGVSALEMLETKNFIINTYNYEIDYWNAKPPLSFWASGLGVIFFDNTLFGLRFFSAFFSGITVFFVVLFAAKKFSLAVSLVSGAILVSLNRFVMTHNVRTADPDALFIMLSVLALLCMLCMNKKKWLFFVAVGCVSLAFLTKGFHAAVPGCIVLILAVWELRSSFFSVRNLLYSLLIFSLPVIVWAIFRYSYDGFEFLERMFFYDVLKRATSSIEGHYGPYYYYFNIIIKEFKHIFLTIFALYLWLCFERKKLISGTNFFPENITDTYLKILFCIIFPILIFSLASSKLGWYVYLTFPFISIACAVVLISLIDFACAKANNINLRKNMVIFLLLIFSIQEGYLIHKIIQKKEEVDFVQSAIFEASQKQKNVSMFIEGDEWHQRFVLAAKLYGKFRPQSGGQSAWTDSGRRGDVLILITGETNAQILVK